MDRKSFELWLLQHTTTMVDIPAVRILVFFLAVCGICPLSAISERIPQWLDAFNALFRLAFAFAYAYSFMMASSMVNGMLGKTFQVSLVLVRCMLVIYQIFAILMHPVFGRCLFKLMRTRIRSAFVLAPFLIYTMTIFSFGFLWSHPFQSWNSLSLIFPFLSLTGSVAVAALMTVCLENCKQKLQKINDKMENPPKSVTELEYLLAWSAKKRAELTELMADMEKGLGSMVSATVFSICLRLSFMTFVDLSTAMKVLSGSFDMASVIGTSMRVILKITVLLQLAHSGQLLVEEGSRSQIYLDRIITQNHTLPSVIIYQIGKCRQVFANGKTTINVWGFFTLDHSLISMMVNIMFSLVLIQIQFFVSETVSAP